MPSLQPQDGGLSSPSHRSELPGPEEGREPRRALLPQMAMSVDGGDKESTLLRQKVEVGNSRQSVEGARRYELRSRSKSPRNTLNADGRPTSPCMVIPTPADSSDPPAAKSGRAKVPRVFAHTPPRGRTMTGAGGNGGAQSSQLPSTVPSSHHNPSPARLTTPVVHKSRSPSPSAKKANVWAGGPLPPQLPCSSVKGYDKNTGKGSGVHCSPSPAKRSLPIVHDKVHVTNDPTLESPAPGTTGLQEQYAQDRVAERRDLQNCDPNAPLVVAGQQTDSVNSSPCISKSHPTPVKVWAARDLRGRMTAALATSEPSAGACDIPAMPEHNFQQSGKQSSPRRESHDTPAAVLSDLQCEPDDRADSCSSPARQNSPLFPYSCLRVFKTSPITLADTRCPSVMHKHDAQDDKLQIACASRQEQHENTSDQYIMSQAIGEAVFDSQMDNNPYGTIIACQHAISAASTQEHRDQEWASRPDLRGPYLNMHIVRPRMVTLEQEELRSDYLTLKQRVLDLELEATILQTQNSDYKQSILWLEKAREEDRKKMVENGRVEAAAQRIEFLEEALASEIQKALESKEELEREQSYAHVKIQELQEQIHELTLNTVRNKETNDSARRVLHLHEGHGHEPLDPEAYVQQEAHSALLQSELSRLSRKLEQRDKRIADLTRQLEALECGKHTMILQQDQAKVARLLTENEEMKKLLREVNIPCSGDQKSMQDLLTQNQTQEKELITLRKLERNSKELQQCLHTAQLQTRELAAMITAVRVEYAVVNDEVQEAFDVIWQRTYRNLLLQLSMSGSNLCDAVTQTSITFCSEADWLECHMHKDNLERMHTRYSEMEKRYSGLETTIEWLEKDKASCDQKCTDLQLMCVAYREKIQELEEKIQGQDHESLAKEKSLKKQIATLKDEFEDKLRAHIAAQEVTLRAEEEVVRGKETETMHKFALAEEKYQHQINEYLAKNESLQDKVDQGRAQITILEKEIFYLTAKVKELQSRSLIGSSSLLHKRSRPLDGEIDRLFGGGLDSPWAHNTLAGVWTGDGGHISQELENVWLKGREMVRSARIQAVEVEASCSRLSRELNSARARIERLEQRLQSSEHARIKAETSRCGSGVVVQINSTPAGDIDRFQRVAHRGDMNKLVEMYKSLQAEVETGREAARNGLKVLDELRAQRIRAVEMEAQASILQEAKDAAERELAAAHGVMYMRAAIHKSSAPLTDEPMDSSLTVNLATIEDLFLSMQRRFSSAWQGNKDALGGCDGQRAQDSTTLMLETTQVHSFERKAPERYQRERVVGGIDQHRERARDGSEGTEVSMRNTSDVHIHTRAPSSLSASLPPTFPSSRSPSQPDAATGFNEAATGKQHGQPQRTGQGRAASRDGDDRDWGSRSCGTNFKAPPSMFRTSAAQESKANACDLETAHAGEAWKRTLEIRRILGK